MLFGYPTGLGLRDLDGTATRSLLLVSAVALAAVGLWALSRERKVDAVLASVLALLSAAWYFASESVPGWWITILPFTIVLVVLVFFSQRLRPPRAAGIPYRRGET